jgi:phospholipase C
MWIRSIAPPLAGGVAAASMLACSIAAAQVSDQELGRIENIVVIYPENRSFDHLYGSFPGANGIAQATDEEKTQLDHDGTPLRYLVVLDGGKPDPRFPRLPNRPFFHRATAAEFVAGSATAEPDSRLLS